MKNRFHCVYELVNKLTLDESIILYEYYDCYKNLKPFLTRSTLPRYFSFSIWVMVDTM